MGLLELVASNIVLQIIRLASDFVLLGIFNFFKRRLQQKDSAFLCRDVCGKEVRGAGGYGCHVMFVGATLFLDCVRQADLKEVKLLSPTVFIRHEPRPVAPTANLAVVHVQANKTPFVVWGPPLTQQSSVVAQEVPHVIRAPSSTPEVTVNIKHGVAHIEADVDPWTAMVLVFMGLGGAGATSLAVFLVWLVKFIRKTSSYMRELVRMLTPEDQQDPEAQPVVDLLGLEETDKAIAEGKEEELVLEDNNPFKEMLNTRISFVESDQQMDKIPVEESISNLG
ncbi:unnamed protein product [Notodromas monacha]|uniref:Uncharacterized protein n=1 Tax=Notodromas monacha TaxID=399045 RepID=A0A7R9BYS7_9CRUS|nr:unnamed protein product [Notodromas monacha]CAG0923321.1 unnamed protein product [Notodromas monacha]